MKKLSLGIQDFPASQANNLIYIDKTQLIHRPILLSKYGLKDLFALDLREPQANISKNTFL